MKLKERIGKLRIGKLVVAVLAVLQGISTLPPIILTFWLYRFAQRAVVLLGHWPVPMIDDPKHFGENDAQYQRLGDVASQWNDLTFSCFFVWFVLMVILYRRYTVRTRWIQIVLFVVGWGVLWFNPWQLLYWWED